MENTLINILTRTSNRPKGFKRCYESIQNQTHKNIRHLVSYDDKKDLAYLNGLDIDLFDVRYLKNTPITPPKGRKPFVYNLYINHLLEQVEEGWVLILDDDDYLINNQAISNLINYINSEDALLIFQMERPKRPSLPEHTHFRNKTIAPSHIGSPCILFNSKYKDKAKFLPYKAGDFDFIKKLFDIIPIKIWIEKPFVKLGNHGGFGMRRDI